MTKIVQAPDPRITWASGHAPESLEKRLLRDQIIELIRWVIVVDDVS
jgi:hypothetical protein